MVVTLEPETEQWIVDEARRMGTSPERFVADRLRRQREMFNPLSVVLGDEAQLLAKINDGFPPEFWEKYRQLIARRESCALSEEQREELIDLSDQIEAKNVARLPHLIALAQRREISLPTLIQQLGLRPVAVNP